MDIELETAELGVKCADLEVKAATAQALVAVMCSVVPEEEAVATRHFFQAAEEVFSTEASALRFLVGYAEGEPVATSSVFFVDKLAAIFDVIVHPKMRGRGLGKEITLSVMRTAKEAGCNGCILTATNDAKYLYEKLGFREVKQMGVFS